MAGVVDAGGVEAGGFQQDARGCFGNLAVEAAHDAGDGYRPGAVADDQHILG